MSQRNPLEGGGGSGAGSEDETDESDDAENRTTDPNDPLRGPGGGTVDPSDESIDAPSDAPSDEPTDEPSDEPTGDGPTGQPDMNEPTQTDTFDPNDPLATGSGPDRRTVDPRQADTTGAPPVGGPSDGPQTDGPTVSGDPSTRGDTDDGGTTDDRLTADDVPVSGGELQSLRQDVAGQSDMYETSDVRLEREEDSIRAFIPLDTQREAFRERVADEQDLPVRVIDVTTRETDGETTFVASFDESAAEPLPGSEPDRQDAQQLANIDSDDIVTDVPTRQDAIGQTTDPTYDPRTAGQPSFTDAVTGGTVAFFRDPYGTTVGHGVESMENELSEEVGFDVGGTVETTGETLANRPVDSTVTGFETIVTGAEASARDGTAAAAAVPASATGTATGAATGVSVSSAGVVLLPAAAAALGVRGAQERGVSPAPLDTETGRAQREIVIDETTQPGETQGEIETPEQTGGTVVSGSEIQIDDRMQPTDTDTEIDVPTGDTTVGDTGGTTGEIPVDETTQPGETPNEIDVPTDEEPTVGEPEASVIVDQPGETIGDEPGGEFEELPREKPIEPTDEALYEETGGGALSQRDDRGTEADEYLFGDVLGSSFGAETTEPEITFETGFGSGSGTGPDVLGGTDTAPDVLADPTTGPTTIPDTATDTITGFDTSFGTQPAAETATETDVTAEQATEEAYAYEYAYEYQTGQRSGRRARLRLPDLLDADSPVPDESDSDEGFGSIEVGLFRDPLSGVFE